MSWLWNVPAHLSSARLGVGWLDQPMVTVRLDIIWDWCLDGTCTHPLIHGMIFKHSNRFWLSAVLFLVQPLDVSAVQM
jgi:hypothetical protein